MFIKRISQVFMGLLMIVALLCFLSLTTLAETTSAQKGYLIATIDVDKSLQSKLGEIGIMLYNTTTKENVLVTVYSYNNYTARQWISAGTYRISGFAMNDSRLSYEFVGEFPSPFDMGTDTHSLFLVMKDTGENEDIPDVADDGLIDIDAVNKLYTDAGLKPPYDEDGNPIFYQSVEFVPEDEINGKTSTTQNTGASETNTVETSTSATENLESDSTTQNTANTSISTEEQSQKKGSVWNGIIYVVIIVAIIAIILFIRYRNNHFLNQKDE